MITLYQDPQRVTPVNNPVVFSFLSTNVNLSGHSYIFDAYSAGTNTQLCRLTVPALPVVKYGTANISRVLNSFVSYNFNPSSATIAKKIINPLKSYINFQIRVGEEYIYQYPFYDSLFVGVFFPSSPFSGSSYTLFSGFAGGQHYFQVGDLVSITQTTGGTPGSQGPYDGNEYTVVNVPNSNCFIVNAQFQGSPNNSSGTSVYSNLRPTRFFNIYTSSTIYTASNAVFPTEDYVSYLYSPTYNCNTPTGKFFTNVYDGYRVRMDSYMGLNFFNTVSTSGNTILRIETRSTGGTIGVYNLNRVANPYNVMYQAMLGPYNLSLITSGDVSIVQGTLPIIKPDTASYSAYTLNSASARTSEVRSFVLDHKCSKFENIQLVFMDRKGSFVPWNYTLASKKNVTVTRNTYKQSLGSIDSEGKFLYNTYDRGTTSINNQIEYEYTAQSAFMTDQESVFYEELITSPEVYWYKDSSTWVAVTITNNELDVKRKIVGNLIQYEVKFKPANQPLVQIN